MNKKGFVSTALIYTFFVLFLVLMVFLLNNYSSTRYIVDRYRYDIKEELYELSNADINLYTFVWSNRDKEYKYVDNIPSGGFKENISYCKNKSTIEFSNGEVTVSANGKDFCYLYFDAAGDVTSPTITASDGKGETSWHKGGVTLNFSGSTIQNGVGEITYYYSTDASNINNEGTSTGVINTEGTFNYYVKACNTYNTEICSEVVSYEIMIDTNKPTITFGLDGQTATYTCSNGGSGSPLINPTSGSQALSGSHNYTYEVTCTDEAGNSKTDSHTYTYGVISGKNTCQYGCDTCGGEPYDCDCNEYYYCKNPGDYMKNNKCYSHAGTYGYCPSYAAFCESTNNNYYHAYVFSSNAIWNSNCSTCYTDTYSCRCNDCYYGSDTRVWGFKY